MTKWMALQQIYQNPNSVAGFSSPETFYNFLKNTRRQISRKDVKQFLAKQKSYALHRNRRKRFKRRKILTRGIGYQLESDLASMQSLSSQNKGVNYILCVIDAFSRKAYVETLYTKTGQEVASKFEKILKRIPHKIINLHSDEGGEYFNQSMAKLLSKYKINHFYTSSDTKAAIAEKFIQFLKRRLYSYMTHAGKNRYIHVLKPFVSAYNRRKHRSIGLAPNQVNKENERDVWKFQYRDQIQTKPYKYKYSVGDKVRISVYSNIFRKGYAKTFSDATYEVYKQLKTLPVTYHLRNTEGDILQGSFYEAELQIA